MILTIAHVCTQIHFAIPCIVLIQIWQSVSDMMSCQVQVSMKLHYNHEIGSSGLRMVMMTTMDGHL